MEDRSSKVAKILMNVPTSQKLDLLKLFTNNWGPIRFTLHTTIPAESGVNDVHLMSFCVRLPSFHFIGWPSLRWYTLTLVAFLHCVYSSIWVYWLFSPVSVFLNLTQPCWCETAIFPFRRSFIVIVIAQSFLHTSSLHQTSFNLINILLGCE